jgi:hypothetical protein
LKTSLHFRKKPRKKTVVTEGAKTVISEEVSGSGGVIGFWLLPTSSGYVKLKIQESYPVKTVNDRSLLVRTVSVKSDAGGSMLPVWPVVNSTDILSKFYNWIENAAPSRDSGLWSTDVTKRTQAAKNYQQQLLSNGFCFAIRDGDTVKWCGKNKKLLGAFMQELSGLKLFNPTNLSILVDRFDSDNPKESEVTKLVLMNDSGVPQKTLTLDSVFKSLFQKREAAFSAYINNIETPVISDFYDGEIVWESPTNWAGIKTEKIIDAMRPESLVREFVKAGDKKVLMASATVAINILKSKGLLGSIGWDHEEIKKAAVNAPEIAKLISSHIRLPQSLPPPSLQNESTLIESSFKELLRDTVANGRYKIGGLRRIGRIWVYDRSIPDRASNSRFVVTRRPALKLGDDGFPVYMFQFRSRPDRNTTNMAHQGYVKFIEKPKFLARVRNFFRDEIDLQVHVFCTCPDFKYRWHWVLAKNNCSHKPTGIGFDATDQPPNQTNPGGLVSMCKHLVVAKDYILLSANEHQKIVKNLQKSSPLKPAKAVDDPDSREVKPGTEVNDTDE